MIIWEIAVVLNTAGTEPLSPWKRNCRWIFATELVNIGMPIRIGAALLGHLDITTTRGYVAVFDEDVVRHYHAFLADRRAIRPSEKYRATAEEEWNEFEAHFDLRKVELGACNQPYGSPRQHEHACAARCCRWTRR